MPDAADRVPPTGDVIDLTETTDESESDDSGSEGGSSVTSATSASESAAAGAASASDSDDGADLRDFIVPDVDADADTVGDDARGDADDDAGGAAAADAAAARPAADGDALAREEARAIVDALGGSAVVGGRVLRDRATVRKTVDLYIDANRADIAKLLDADERADAARAIVALRRKLVAANGSGDHAVVGGGAVTAARVRAEFKARTVADMDAEIAKIRAALGMPPESSSESDDDGGDADSDSDSDDDEDDDEDEDEDDDDAPEARAPKRAKTARASTTAT